jgi:hypothetical protein
MARGVRGLVLSESCELKAESFSGYNTHTRVRVKPADSIVFAASRLFGAGGATSAC